METAKTLRNFYMAVTEHERERKSQRRTGTCDKVRSALIFVRGFPPKRQKTYNCACISRLLVRIVGMSAL